MGKKRPLEQQHKVDMEIDRISTAMKLQPSRKKLGVLVKDMAKIVDLSEKVYGRCHLQTLKAGRFCILLNYHSGDFEAMLSMSDDIITTKWRQEHLRGLNAHYYAEWWRYVVNHILAKLSIGAYSEALKFGEDEVASGSIEGCIDGSLQSRVMLGLGNASEALGDGEKARCWWNKALIAAKSGRDKNMANFIEDIVKRHDCDGREDMITETKAKTDAVDARCRSRSVWMTYANISDSDEDEVCEFEFNAAVESVECQRKGSSAARTGGGDDIDAEVTGLNDQLPGQRRARSTSKRIQTRREPLSSDDDDDAELMRGCESAVDDEYAAAAAAAGDATVEESAVDDESAAAGDATVEESAVGVSAAGSESAVDDESAAAAGGMGDYAIEEYVPVATSSGSLDVAAGDVLDDDSCTLGCDGGDLRLADAGEIE